MKATEKSIADALRAKFGNCTEAAKALGMEPPSLRERIRKSPKLQKILDEARESIVDLAETMLAVAVRKGEDWAVKRVLDSKHGVMRGWRPPQQLEIEATAVALTPEERDARICDILGIPRDAPAAIAPPLPQLPPAP